ncbi:MAG: hypothetical protein JWR26_615 [Pedosphaera sp.]|nr:hypothetical protein [Pedosphaera sp.]
MKKLGLVLMILGCLGVAVVALGFAADFQPMWLHSVRSLPDKEVFTRHEVGLALVGQVEYNRTRFLAGTIFSFIEIAGAIILLKRSARS